MLKDKRGIELGWTEIFTILFIVAIIIIVGMWISHQASGEAFKKQVLAKDICLLTTSSLPNTIITIEHKKEVTIEKKDAGIVVKSSPTDRGYFYDCYLKDIDIFRKDDVTIIKK